jgi:hypothetical protein
LDLDIEKDNDIVTDHAESRISVKAADSNRGWLVNILIMGVDVDLQSAWNKTKP